MKFCGSRTGIPFGAVWERGAGERLDALPLTGVKDWCCMLPRFAHDGSGQGLIGREWCSEIHRPRKQCGASSYTTGTHSWSVKLLGSMILES